jgi:hypothetical protein
MPMTDKDKAQVQKALDNHDRLQNAYFWTPAGNASSRRYDEKRYSFSVQVEHEGHDYEYDSQVQCSVKNFYYRGAFYKNGKLGDVRIFKKLIKQLEEGQNEVVNFEDRTGPN